MKLFFLLIFSSLSAADLVLETEVGYQSSDFHWDIGSQDGYPNILSELEWKNLDGPYGLARLKGDFPASQSFVFIEGSGSVTTNGRVIDSDYRRRNRKDIFLRTVSSAKNSPCWGIRGAFGRYFFPFDACMRLDLSIGFRLEQERLKIDGGELLISKIGPVSFEGLRSRYVAQWMGPEANVSIDYHKGCFSLAPAISLFVPRYLGKGYWNLSQYFVGPFRHKSWGYGYDFRVRGAYHFYCLNMGLNFHLFGMRASKGDDTTYVLDDFGEIVEAKGRLNQVAFNSRMYTVNVSFDF